MVVVSAVSGDKHGMVELSAGASGCVIHPRGIELYAATHTHWTMEGRNEGDSNTSTR